MTSFKAISRIAPLFLLAACAFGEGARVCMGGDVQQLTAPQLQACQTLVQQVREAAAKYHTPAWHFIVVCDENGWKDYAAFSETPAEALQNASADTNLALHTTFFRGSRLHASLADNVLETEMTAILHNSTDQIASSR